MAWLITARPGVMVVAAPVVMGIVSSHSMTRIIGEALPGQESVSL